MAVPLLRFSLPSLSSKSSVLYPNLVKQQQQFQSKAFLDLPKDCIRLFSSASTLKQTLPLAMTTHTTTNISDGGCSASPCETTTAPQVPDIEDYHAFHEQAMKRAESTYIDPETGYTVFTELTHLKRGKCCGNRCRHCPYGFEKVRPPGGFRKGSWRSRRANSKLDASAPPPPPPSIPGAPIAKLRSGDTETAQRMVREILERAETAIDETESSGGGRIGMRNLSTPLKEIEDEDDDDLSSTSSSSSSSYSSSSCSSAASTQEANDESSSIRNNNTTNPSTITIIESVKDTVTSSTSSAATATSATSASSNSNPGSSDRIPTRIPTKNVPYTRTGDQGTSQLLTGERRSKTDDAFEAMGTVDELCSFVGVAHAQLLQNSKTNSGRTRNSNRNSNSNSKSGVYGELPVRLLDVMSRLFDVGSHVAKPTASHKNNHHEETVFVPNGIGDGFDKNHVDDLEDWINQMTHDLPELTSFILPTGAQASAALHVARTVCRRAERRVVPLVVDHQTCDPNALRYLNRLSDFFFVAARWVNYKEGQEEIEYRLDIYDSDDDDHDNDGNPGDDESGEKGSQGGGNEDQRERVVRSLGGSSE